MNTQNILEETIKCQITLTCFLLIHFLSACMFQAVRDLLAAVLKEKTHSGQITQSSPQVRHLLCIMVSLRTSS